MPVLRNPSDIPNKISSPYKSNLNTCPAFNSVSGSQKKNQQVPDFRGQTPGRRHSRSPSQSRGHSHAHRKICPHTSKHLFGIQDDQHRRIVKANTNRHPPERSNNQNHNLGSNAMKETRSSVTRSPSKSISGEHRQGHGRGHCQIHGPCHRHNRVHARLHDNALSELKQMFTTRLDMLAQLQEFQNQFDKETSSKFKIHSQEIDQAKKKSRAQDKIILNLKHQLDQVRVDLQENVDLLARLIRKTQRKGGKVRTEGTNVGDEQNMEHDQGQSSVNEESDNEEESTDSNYGSDNSENDEDADVELDGEWDDDMEKHINYLNETLTGHKNHTSNVVTTKSQPTWSSKINTLSLMPPEDEMTTQIAQFTEVLAHDETVLGPIKPKKNVKKTAVAERLICPHCQSSYSSSYLQRHVKSHCKNSPIRKSVKEAAAMTFSPVVDVTGNNLLTSTPIESTARAQRAMKRRIEIG